MDAILYTHIQGGATLTIKQEIVPWINEETGTVDRLVNGMVSWGCLFVGADLPIETRWNTKLDISCIIPEFSGDMYLREYHKDKGMVFIGSGPLRRGNEVYNTRTGRFVRIKASIKTANDLAKTYYGLPGNSVGGIFHCVLEDGNIKDGHIRECLENARAAGDVLGIVLGEYLLTLSKTQRTKLTARYKYGGW